MKNILALSVAVVFLFIQCKTASNSPNETETTTQTITFKGKIEGATDQSVRVMSSFERSEADLKDGQFEIRMPVNEPIIVDFYYKGNYWTAFAKPGETIEMQFAETNFDSTFTISKYEAESKLANELQEELKKFNENYKEFFGLGEEQFIKATDSLSLNGIAKIIKSSIAHPTMDPLFKSWLNSMVIYDVAGYVENYPSMHRRVTKDTSYVIGVGMNEARSKVKKERANLLSHPTYASYLETKMNNLAMETYKAIPDGQATDADYMNAQLKAIDGHFEHSALKEYLTFVTLRDQLAYIGVNNTKAHLQPFLTNTKSVIYKEQLNELFEKWEHLQAGKIAPGFTYPDIEGVLHSLSDYKGKYVYIDVWATWCGPCIAEQPALEKLEAHYEDNQNIVFLGVSIDNDKAAWEKMVKEKKLKGVQLLATNGFNSELNKSYNISGIPRFILVDKKGNLISASAERPSSKTLERQLAALLEGEVLEGD